LTGRCDWTPATNLLVHGLQIHQTVTLPVLRGQVVIQADVHPDDGVRVKEGLIISVDGDRRGPEPGPQPLDVPT
jgi:hypothetical protein